MVNIDEISTRIHSSNFFTLLDCKRGFWQIPVTERTQNYLAFATPWGRYTCLRLPFGLSSAPEVFQQIMSSLFHNLSNVECSVDDIIIHAPTLEELEKRTKEVIMIIQEAGLKLNKDKCEFNKKSLKFLGHIISSDSIAADNEKLVAIHQLETPKNIKQVQRLLGMVTYISKFVADCSEITAPIRELLKVKSEFIWDEPQENAFTKIKQILTSLPVLQFYDVNNKKVKLSVDASQHAIGAVLLQNNHPIAYASRSLSTSEKNYPQIEKEAQAIRFACKKFHSYIYGKE